MPQTVELALANATFFSDNQTYKLIQLHPRAITVAASIVAEIGEPFCGLLVDKDEVTLMIPADASKDFTERLKAHITTTTEYRLITIDVVLEPTLVGFIAHLSNALAQAGISILPFSAYSRDHLFVMNEDFNKAINILESLKTKQ